MDLEWLSKHAPEITGGLLVILHAFERAKGRFTSSSLEARVAKLEAAESAREKAAADRALDERIAAAVRAARSEPSTSPSSLTGPLPSPSSSAEPSPPGPSSPTS